MLFSIVIPVYNVEKYLEECLDSIIPQAKRISGGCEIIIVDDGSTDSSGRICDLYSQKENGLIHVFHRTNHGLLLTRRFGYQHTSGDYIINCDSDDFLETNALQVLCKTIEQYNQPDMIIFNHYNYIDGKRAKSFENIFTDKESCTVQKNAVLKEYLSGYSIVSVWGAICKRSCIEINKDYSGYNKFNSGEDSLQKLEQFDNAKTYVYVNMPLYDYRISSGMTAKYNPNYYSSFRKIFDEISNKKELWNFDDKGKYFAIKFLGTTGRAITQLRYDQSNNVVDKIKYLTSIRNDDKFQQSYKYLHAVKNKLQFDHVIFIKLLWKKKYKVIIKMLDLKNRSDQRKSKRRLEKK